jgi:hypothetical protein
MRRKLGTYHGTAVIHALMQLQVYSPTQGFSTSDSITVIVIVALHDPVMRKRVPIEEKYMQRKWLIGPRHILGLPAHHGP